MGRDDIVERKDPVDRRSQRTDSHARLEERGHPLDRDGVERVLEARVAEDPQPGAPRERRRSRVQEARRDQHCSGTGGVDQILLTGAHHEVEHDVGADAPGLLVTGNAEATDDAWALVAARLGRQSHRREFVRRFWWGKRVRAGASAGIDEEEGEVGLFETLRRFEEERHPASAWDEAVVAFRSALQTAESLRDERQAAYGLITREHELRTAWHTATQALGAAEQDDQEARALQQRHEQELASAESPPDPRGTVPRRKRGTSAITIRNSATISGRVFRSA